MANTQAIKKRMRSITTTQKITKAMKLVSLSKLQHYREQQSQFSQYFEALEAASLSIGGDDNILDAMQTIYLAFMPDLGLCSMYTQGMMRMLEASMHEGDGLMLIGTQGYEHLRERGFNIINPIQSSEKIDVTLLHRSLSAHIASYRIVAIIPEFTNALSLGFTARILNLQKAEPNDDVLYEPNFTDVRAIVNSKLLAGLIRHTWLTSKVSEHTTRRIAMEKATDSAQDMLDVLERTYNRVRQEAITQEISEIVSGMEDS
ncbi:F0F1 ATP synthase subunit gamma [Erysipelothrix sp. HDW6C]|uniref:F0F1 ATP synthase subunit gamma n=1 Tax=Erysipelothrix sp. HDW6C TaxID=2714930 RepID=UPI00140C1EA8|nr:FoF1 ATP synthase subunit gamma [Erysipelothrix sp. HDW6C]QIK69736.1 F0F1 ATP synthase subunit gamma [Erysipelothrix sp. HDW6C]